ncbi:CLUMA_CG000425, isoform A [Clunio marinus]|uniref:CLUMA_CG000425, isoform A n=1 Tax=Clunio marinus TaxID=568069 RepID=A0A1J1HEJ9_9DIPT|nr:CLUMA_CG000425, isoform A [Clunio marinus]
MTNMRSEVKLIFCSHHPITINLHWHFWVLALPAPKSSIQIKFNRGLDVLKQFHLNVDDK